MSTRPPPAVPLYSGEVGPRAHQPRRGRLDARAPADPIHTGRPKAFRVRARAALCSAPVLPIDRVVSGGCGGERGRLLPWP
uniref:Uncharacterized protein n=1 Tax=Zea mays TaxID=4577 RepID=C4J437_MAIZE|nr:unknown [Zea mays]